MAQIDILSNSLEKGKEWLSIILQFNALIDENIVLDKDFFSLISLVSVSVSLLEGSLLALDLNVALHFVKEGDSPYSQN